MSNEPTAQSGGLPKEVFERFLAALEGIEIPEEVRDRLRKTLLIDQKFTDSALRAAVIGEEEGQ